ncbi:MAG: SRPBCC family protein [Caulobacterales bacterium]
MKTNRLTAGLALIAGLAWAGVASAAEYISIVQEIAVGKPADEVWKKIGKFCDIQVWMKGATCVYTSGDGGLGTNRLIVGRINEVMVSRTDLSYTYAQPLAPNMYHGSVEAKPVTATTSKIIYTLLYDVSMLPDQAAKDADRAGRAAQFMRALQSMKALAEAP